MIYEMKNKMLLFRCIQLTYHVFLQFVRETTVEVTKEESNQIRKYKYIYQ
jgi:hypothetical protein